jgi:phage replication initiation protein
LTDFLNVTFRFDGSPQALGGLVRRISEELSPKLGALTDRNRGLHGYRHSLAFDNGGALFAHGGQRGTGFLSMPGEACALVPDWQRAYLFLRDELQAKITRWDGAVDDFKGEHSVDLAMQWYLGGSFGTGGNKPSMRQAGNWAEPDGTGRTIYIGKGAHGKMLRVYEKGKQLGDSASPWVRWELQLGNRDRVIPLEVLLNPGPYVAGAYDCLGWINEEASRVRVVRKTAQIGYAALTEHARNAYGRFLYVMRDVEGSDEAVLDKLVVPGFPKRLQMPDIDMPQGEP